MKIAVALLLMASFAGPRYATSQSPPGFAELYEQGKRAAAAQDYQAAAGLFGRAAAAQSLQGGTTPSDALLQQAKCFVHLANYTQADAALRQYLKTAPHPAEALYLLGFVQQRENNPKASLQTYTEAARAAPPAAEDLRRVALDYVLLDDYPDAVHWLNRALQMDDRSDEAWYDLARAEMHEGRFGDAITALRRSLQLNPANDKALDNLGVCLENQNKPEEATKAYAEAVKVTATASHPNAQPYVDYGALLNTRNAFAEALPLLTRAAALAPDNAHAFEELARACTGLGRTPEAQAAMEHAVALDPKNSRLHFQLGRIYRSAGKAELAAREFQASSALYGGHSNE